VELVQKGVPMNTKLGVLWVHGGGRERRIPSLYLNIPGRTEEEDGMKGCILWHAKHCYRPSSQGRVFLLRVEGDVDPREVLLWEDIKKK
jgi:hypothetical protein